jgi:hypothetical protein
MIKTTTDHKPLVAQQTSVANARITNSVAMPAVPVLQQQEKEEPIQEVAVQKKEVVAQFASDDIGKPPLKPFQLKSNNAGMPDTLKSGIEQLSGISMDHVKVHYNSSQPAQLNAHAYAQGSDIHIAPGQEKHLPHEAWHVVQQAQGRVQATKQMKQNVAVNDDPGLEHEADVMGEKALSSGAITSENMIQAKAVQTVFNVIQPRVIFGTTEFSNMQEVAQNTGAWHYYQQLIGTPRSDAFKTALAEGDAVTTTALFPDVRPVSWETFALIQNYTRKTQNELTAQLIAELTTWNALDPKPLNRYDTGYNGPNQPNEVVSQAVCDAVAAAWNATAIATIGACSTHQAWSNTVGVKTGKRMHDFLIQQAGKSVFNFHIEVERGNP